jgi:molecular chaperone GrpE
MQRPDSPTPPYPNNPLPVHLMKRRKQHHHLRRRKFCLDSLLNPQQAQSQPEQSQSPSSNNSDTDLESMEAQLVRAHVKIQQLEQRLLSTDGVKNALEDKLLSNMELLEKKTNAFEEAKKVVEIAKGHVQRSRQEMEQQRKRLQKEKDDIQKYAAEELLHKLFPVVDNFHVAAQTLENRPESMESLLNGITMIHREMMKILSDAGLQIIPSINTQFNPELHDAISTESNLERPDGEITQEIRTGYLLGDKLLRPSVVVVNKHPGAPPIQPSSERNALPELNATPSDIISPLEQARKLLETKIEE